jgi:hypothetical protein
LEIQSLDNAIRKVLSVSKEELLKREAPQKRTWKRKGGQVTDEEIVQAVRWRYRICNYLFRLGAIWILAGAIIRFLATRYDWWNWQGHEIELVGFGIFTAGLAMTFAIYRCPVCDHYLSKYRPDKKRCAHCGANVR